MSNTTYGEGNTVKISLTFDEAKELLLEAVESNGADYTYQLVSVKYEGWDGKEAIATMCANFDPETKAPSCIVGHVFAAKGLTLDALGSTYNLSGVDTIVEEADLLDLDAPTQHLLDRAQVNQDAGIPWGEAVRSAIEDTLATYPELLAEKV